MYPIQRLPFNSTEVERNRAKDSSKRTTQMTITCLAVHIEPGTLGEIEQSLATPLMLAESFAAHMSALVFPADIGVTTADYTERELAALESDTAAHVRDLAGRRSVSFDIRARSSFRFGVGEVFADQIRVSDLGVITIGVGHVYGYRFLLGGAVFESGRPTLLAPAHTPLLGLPRRIVIGWDATPAAVRAVHCVMPFLQRCDEAFVVTVTDDKDIRPGQSGIELTRLLSRHGVKASFVSARKEGGSVLDALSRTAREREADLLTLGAVRHAPLHDLIYGSATKDLFMGTAHMAAIVAA